MRKNLIAAGAALIIGAAFAGSAAADSSFGRGTHQPDSGHRWSHKHQRVCRDVYKSKVVWHHGHRKVVKVKVGRRCY